MLFSVSELLKFTNNLRKANEKVIYLLGNKIGGGKIGGSIKCCHGYKELGILMPGWLEYEHF